MRSFVSFLSSSSRLGLWSVVVWGLALVQGCGGDPSVAPAGYSISGQVVGQTAYLSEVAIYLSESAQDTVWTDAEGRFVFADLPAGRYRLVPFKAEHLFFPAEQQVVLTDEDAVGVEFVEVFAVLAVSVDHLEVDGTPQRRVVELTNDGLGRLSWQVRHSAGWLSVGGSGFDGEVEERADGSLAGQGTGVLTIETSGAELAAGTYLDTLYVQSNGGAVAIPVRMHIAALPDGDEGAFPVGVNNADGIFRIAFISNLGEVNGWVYDLFVMDGDGGNLVNLTSDRAHNGDPAWSPDGQRIAFSRTLSFSSNDTDYDLWVIDADGSNLVQLTQGPSQDRRPAWSPDGHHIAYAPRSSRDEDITDLWVIDADGSNPVNLTSDSDIDFDPAWSPDGQRIAYASAPDRESSTDLWVMDANGENPINLTMSTESEFYPAWSPDGRRIAYHSNRDGSTDLWVMDANGDNPVNLTMSTENERWPSWSPDGQRIAYVCQLGEGDWQICLINADGTEHIQLTDGFRFARDHVWTPDGRRILFSAFVPEPDRFPLHIFSISSDGSDVINLTEEINPDGQYFSPAVSFQAVSAK